MPIDKPGGRIITYGQQGGSVCDTKWDLEDWCSQSLWEQSLKWASPQVVNIPKKETGVDVAAYTTNTLSPEEGFADL